MIFSRGLFLFAMLFSLGWSVPGHAASSKSSAAVVGTWYSATGSITFKADGTINYHGKRYYYAVSNAGMIQLKGRHGELTIPYQLVAGKLTLVERGKTTVHRRRR